MRNNTTDYVNAAVELANRRGYPNQFDCSDEDDFVDAFLECGEKAWGRPNASQRSALEKYARDDYNSFEG